MDENALIIAGKVAKARQSNDDLLVSSDNVYFTSSGVFKLKGKIYAIDETCVVSYEDIVTTILAGDDIVIGLQFPDNKWVAVIIPISLQSRLDEAVRMEYYMLAHELKQQIDNGNKTSN